jgi:hypothetical protein
LWILRSLDGVGVLLCVDIQQPKKSVDKAIVTANAFCLHEQTAFTVSYNYEAWHCATLMLFNKGRFVPTSKAIKLASCATVRLLHLRDGVGRDLVDEEFDLIKTDDAARDRWLYSSVAVATFNAVWRYTTRSTLTEPLPLTASSCVHCFRAQVHPHVVNILCI